MQNLPKTIQDQLERADAILAQQQQAPETDKAETVEQAVQPVQQEPQAQPTQQAPAAQDDVWEKRYKTLQGLFNAEVPKLQAQVKEVSSKYQEAVEKLEQLAARPKQDETPKHVPDQKDVDDFGEDLVAMVRRVAEQVLGSVAPKIDTLLAGMDKRIGALEQGLQGTTKEVAVTREQSFFDKLTKEVPDWEKINADEGFLTWLADIDPVYGQQRQTALDNAQRSLDVARVAAIFNAYRVPGKKTSNAVSKMVTPKSSSTVLPEVAGKPILTEKQVVAFYDSKRRGEYTAEEAARYEAIVNEAIAEGRVR